MARDCGDDSVVGVGSWSRVEVVAVGAEEVKEWQRPGCWAFLFILSLTDSFSKYSLSTVYTPSLWVSGSAGLVKEGCPVAGMVLNACISCASVSSETADMGVLCASCKAYLALVPGTETSGVQKPGPVGLPESAASLKVQEQG